MFVTSYVTFYSFLMKFCNKVESFPSMPEKHNTPNLHSHSFFFFLMNICFDYETEK